VHKVVATAIILASAAVLFAQDARLDYPQWRGLQRDGSASAFATPKNWPGQLRRRWKVEVGEGYSTPILVGERIYVFTRRDGNEVLSALDANSGVERWRSTYPAPYTPGQPAAAHGAGPKATPLFHNGRLFTLGISGIVTAFDAATGTRTWQTAAPAEPPYYGAASSPIGDGAIVMVNPGDYGPLTAFDTATGAVKWTAGKGGFFASPIVATLGGVRQVVAVTQGAVIGVSPTTGAVLWEFPWGGGNGGPTPVLAGDAVIVSGSDRGTVAIRPARRGETWTTQVVWETKDVSMYLSTPVVNDDTLFGFSSRNSGQFFALDTRTGKTLWLGPPREAMNVAVAKSGPLLFLLKNDAQLIVAAISRTGFESRQRYTVADSATWADPVMSGNRLFVKDVSSLTLWTAN
jgi:outer membrane protein assembly factor BamB